MFTSGVLGFLCLGCLCSLLVLPFGMNADSAHRLEFEGVPTAAFRGSALELFSYTPASLKQVEVRVWQSGVQCFGDGDAPSSRYQPKSRAATLETRRLEESTWPRGWRGGHGRVGTDAEIHGLHLGNSFSRCVLMSVGSSRQNPD